MQLKTVLRGKYIAINAYIKKAERFQINNLTFHLKAYEIEKQTKFKVSKGKEKIKTQVEINETQNGKTIHKSIVQNPSWMKNPLKLFGK
jgi:hypothetical protein